MSTVEDIYRAYNDAENAHDLARARELVSDDLVVTINGSPAISSADHDARANAELIRSYPDYGREILDVVADGDRGAIRWRMHGSSSPDATNEIGPLDLHGCSVITVVDGRIVSAALYFDNSSMFRVLERASGAGEPA